MSHPAPRPHHERQAEYEELSRAALEAMETFEATARRLAATEVTERSTDGRVIVRAAADGRVTSVTLGRGTLQRYGSTTLGELVARIVRAAQLKARTEYERLIAAATPPEIAESNRLVREALERQPAADPAASGGPDPAG